MNAPRFAPAGWPEGWAPTIEYHDNGRIGFPGAVRYRLHTRFGGLVLPWPPTAATHPAPAKPVPLSGPRIARLVAEGRIGPLPASLPYTIEVLHADEYRRLCESGWIRDPRHSGARPFEIVDNSPAPGA